MGVQFQKYFFRLAAVSLLVSLSAIVALAQTTSFTYQGRLTDGGTPANGNYDLQFALWDSNSGGTQIGSQTSPNVLVSAGIFTVQLDFLANAFPGANRFLEISARLAGTGSFTTLSPRQQITSTPYAVRALSATTAENLTTAAGGNFIQNTTAPQSSANFNISGNGTASGTVSASIVNATTQYNLGGFRVLSNPGIGNLFTGVNAGAANTTGIYNSFFGVAAGISNTTGGGNSFFGLSAGALSETGFDNSFFGIGAGAANTTGGSNTIIGRTADVGSGNLSNATAIGAQALVSSSNSLVLGSVAGFNFATTSVNVGIGTTTPLATLDTRGTMLVSGNVGIGTTAPEAPLHVNGAAVLRPGGVREISLGTPSGETGIGIKGTSNRADVRFDGLTLKLVAGLNTGPPLSTSGINITTTGAVGIGTTSPFVNTKLDIVGGLLRLDQLAGGGDEPLCRHSVFHTIATCSSSLRYKEQIAPYNAGLELINRLRPISFAWKAGGRHDLGLGAEDVAKVEPLLVTHNDKGEIEGVKYDRLNVVLINAIKQQQSQIERQQNLIKQQEARLTGQQQQLASLKRLVCLNHRRASICK